MSMNATLSSFTFFAKERNVLAFFSVLCKIMLDSLHSFRSLQKNVGFFAFFSVLSKRMLHSLCSFPFFGKERNVLLGLISRQKVEKNGKERNVPFKERKRTRCQNVIWKLGFSTDSLFILQHFILFKWWISYWDSVMKKLVGWSDLALFSDFRQWTHCCRSGIF